MDIKINKIEDSLVLHSNHDIAFVDYEVWFENISMPFACWLASEHAKQYPSWGRHDISISATVFKAKKSSLYFRFAVKIHYNSVSASSLGLGDKRFRVIIKDLFRVFTIRNKEREDKEDAELQNRIDINNLIKKNNDSLKTRISEFQDFKIVGGTLISSLNSYSNTTVTINNKTYTYDENGTANVTW